MPDPATGGEGKEEEEEEDNDNNRNNYCDHSVLTYKFSHCVNVRDCTHAS